MSVEVKGLVIVFFCLFRWVEVVVWVILWVCDWIIDWYVDVIV